jgi:subtilisin family serine protease
MKRLLSLLTIVSIFSMELTAQSTTKLDLRLWNRLQKGEVRNVNLPLLVRGKASAVQQLTEQYGGLYKYGYGDISSVEIPEKNVLKFAEATAIRKVENTQAKGTFLMDTARLRNNVDSVHAGYSPLTTATKGNGVIVGIIDGGIYWQHEDFYNGPNNTRIRYIWDQSVSGNNAPLPYNYGNQWSWLDINNGSCTHVPPTSDFGHGTCVAGIAAGNSNSTKERHCSRIGNYCCAGGRRPKLFE